jgi:hypothetical protein
MKRERLFGYLNFGDWKLFGVSLPAAGRDFGDWLFKAILFSRSLRRQNEDCSLQGWSINEVGCHRRGYDS